MSEAINPPPSLPSSRSKGSKISAALAWIIIVVSVAFLAWTANEPLGEDLSADQAAPEGMVPVEVATELSVLKMQSRFIIGIAQFNKAEAIRSIDQLQGMATTARGKAAVAIVESFVDPKNGLKNGIEFLEKIDTSSVEGKKIKDLVTVSLQNGVSPQGRTELKKHIGWFSGLVRPDEANPDPDYAKEIRAESVKTMTIFGGFFGLASLAWLTGLILLILYFVLRSSGKIKNQYDASDSPSQSHLFVESFAIYIGIMALGHLLGYLVDPRISLAAYGVSFLLALFWPKIRGCSWKQARNLIGWNRGTGFFREVGAGFVGYLGIIVIAGFGLLLTLLLIMTVNLIQNGTTPINGAGTSHPIVGMLESTKSVWGKLSLLFLAAGMAPFLEETMFRGALFRYLRHHWGFLLSSIVGGIIFAIIHPQGIFALPALSAMGIGFALLREWRDSLIASMTAHALNNGVIVGLLLLIAG